MSAKVDLSGSEQEDHVMVNDGTELTMSAVLNAEAAAAAASGGTATVRIDPAADAQSVGTTASHGTFGTEGTGSMDVEADLKVNTALSEALKGFSITGTENKKLMEARAGSVTSNEEVQIALHMQVSTEEEVLAIKKKLKNMTKALRILTTFYCDDSAQLEIIAMVNGNFLSAIAGAGLLSLMQGSRGRGTSPDRSATAVLQKAETEPEVWSPCGKIDKISELLGKGEEGLKALREELEREKTPMENLKALIDWSTYDEYGLSAKQFTDFFKLDINSRIIALKTVALVHNGGQLNLTKWNTAMKPLLTNAGLTGTETPEIMRTKLRAKEHTARLKKLDKYVDCTANTERCNMLELVYKKWELERRNFDSLTKLTSKELDHVLEHYRPTLTGNCRKIQTFIDKVLAERSEDPDEEFVFWWKTRDEFRELSIQDAVLDEKNITKAVESMTALTRQERSALNKISGTGSASSGGANSLIELALAGAQADNAARVARRRIESPIRFSGTDEDWVIRAPPIYTSEWTRDMELSFVEVAQNARKFERLPELMQNQVRMAYCKPRDAVRDLNKHMGAHLIRFMKSWEQGNWIVAECRRREAVFMDVGSGRLNPGNCDNWISTGNCHHGRSCIFLHAKD